MGNIQSIIDNNLCISCGMCVGACGNNCISLHKVNGQVRPVIDSARCTDCGLCQKICPGGDTCKEILDDRGINKKLTGDLLASYVGWAKDRDIQKKSVSGGVTTAIIMELLKKGEYHAALGVETRGCNIFNKVQVFGKAEYAKRYQKSKYFLASYENVIRYIRKNRNKKIIITGVGCVIDSIKKWMNISGINQDNYLFLGLLCDRTLSYGIVDYFRFYDIFKKKKLKSFEYRSKEGDSFWPGNVQLEYEDRDVILPAEERYNVCEYFQNERCLYCLNHMNTGSDISIGDNYTKQYSNKWGSNSIVVRTEKGQNAIGLVSDELKLQAVSIESIEKGQGLSRKADNYKYLQLKNMDMGKCDEAKKEDIDQAVINEYNRRLSSIEVGRKYYKSPYLFNLYFMIKGKSKLKNRLKLWR